MFFSPHCGALDCSFRSGGWNILLYLISGLFAPALLLKSPDLLVIEIGEVANPPLDRAESGEVARTWSVPGATTG